MPKNLRGLAAQTSSLAVPSVLLPSPAAAAFVAVLCGSAATMIWLFWRFPLATAVITLGVFLSLGVSARSARVLAV